ncbi:MAG: outer membrane beta-barrel protein [Bryobacteraceae bacterium]
MRLLLLLAVAAPLAAQSHYPKHNFTIGAGIGLPGAQLTPAFATSGGLSIGYGYRFQRNLQADFGLDTLFGAAGVKDFLATELGYLRIRDFQYLVPFGGRAILPLAEGRVLLSAGGGGAYMRYSERLKQPSSYFRVACPDCNSRSGWGTYALGGVSFALDRFQMFRIGFTAKAYRGHTDGDALGAVPAVETLDRWLNLFGNFSIHF